MNTFQARTLQKRLNHFIDNRLLSRSPIPEEILYQEFLDKQSIPGAPLAKRIEFSVQLKSRLVSLLKTQTVA